MMPLLAAAISEGVMFYPLAILTLAGAFAMILARNPVYAAMSMVLAFFGIAGIYVLLSAQLLAALQIIVYAGAIMVLFLFVIMLLNLSESELKGPRFTLGRLIGGAAALGLLVVLTYALTQLPGEQGPMVESQLRSFGTLGALGQILYTQWLLPFEAVSLLLLVAIVGAVVVAKSRI